MSAPTVLQSNLIPFNISEDGITYKNVVCKKAWNFNGTAPTTNENTDCGVLVALGANEWNFDFDMILNTTPNSATEMSAKEILDIWNTQALSYVKVLYPSGTGANFYVQGEGYITAFKLTNQVGNLMAFSGTFTGNGAVDISY